jgi:hypothetical protein
MGEGGTPLPPLLEAWDYQSELKLFGGLSVDRQGLLLESRLAPQSRLQVLVLARSSSTKVERCVARLDVPELDQYDLALHIPLTGDWLGGRLTIETLLVTTDPFPLMSGGASEPGSILWSEHHSTVLEGLGGLFPTDTEAFSVTRPSHRDAPWVLSVDQGDLEALFAASVRLTLNTDVPSVARLLAEPERDESVRLGRILELDVTRQLVSIAIGSDEILARPVDKDATSLGDVLRLLVSRVWPNASTATLTRWREREPERIELDVHQFGKAFT